MVNVPKQLIQWNFKEICLLVFHTMNIVIFHNLEYNIQIVYAQIRKKQTNLEMLCNLWFLKMINLFWTMTKMRIYKYIKLIICYFVGEKNTPHFWPRGNMHSQANVPFLCWWPHLLDAQGPMKHRHQWIRTLYSRYTVFKLEEARRNMCENF